MPLGGSQLRKHVMQVPYERKKYGPEGKTREAKSFTALELFSV
jgi:hypothetical protein